MSGRLWSRWIWLALAGALACIPAEAQYGYSSIDIDSYGNIAGTSLTEVPYYFPDFGYDAYVEGILNGPGGEMMDLTAFDNGEGLAEVDTYGTASGAGDYAQWGYHEVVTDDEYEYQDIGTTDADVYWSPPCGEELATSEQFDSQYFGTTYASAPIKTTYLEPQPGYYGYYPISESDGGGGDDVCYDSAPTGNLLDDANPILFLPFTVPASNIYWDVNGYSQEAVNYYASMEVLPCGYTLNQVITMWCPEDPTNAAVAQIYEINEIDADIDAVYPYIPIDEWVSRAGYGLAYYF